MNSDSAFPLYLLGKQKVFESDKISEEQLLDFYGEAFNCINQIEATHSLVRRIAYECKIDSNRNLIFIGYQVRDPGTLSEGLVCWTLGTDTLNVLQFRGTRPVQRVVPLKWSWLEAVELLGERWIYGDFKVSGLTFLDPVESTDDMECWMSFNLFEDRTRTYKNGDQIQLSKYDPQWPLAYVTFSEWLKTYFGTTLIKRTEHFGSTAIPMTWAKPIIDILVEVPSFALARKLMLPKLPENWEYCWYNNHMMLIRRDSFMGKRTHHLHIAPSGHHIWERLFFRDYLRSHPQEAQRYSALKKQIVTKYSSDRERYTWSKGDFVREVTAKALRWANR